MPVSKPISRKQKSSRQPTLTDVIDYLMASEVQRDKADISLIPRGTLTDFLSQSSNEIRSLGIQASVSDLSVEPWVYGTGHLVSMNSGKAKQTLSSLEKELNRSTIIKLRAMSEEFHGAIRGPRDVSVMAIAR
jgi:hypothetical protein